jgi:hypothetical protein
VKIVAIICNVLLLLVIGYFLVKEGIVEEKWWIVLVFLAAPIASLLALWGRIEEMWPLVYFQRKALEERKKIEALNAERKP